MHSFLTGFFGARSLTTIAHELRIAVADAGQTYTIPELSEGRLFSAVQWTVGACCSHQPSAERRGRVGRTYLADQIASVHGGDGRLC